MRIVLLGPPGAGKGTQAARVALRLGCSDVATGDILRANVASGTDLGRVAQEYMDRGDLVPDEVVIAMVMARLAEPDCRTGFILDGFPRTVTQAEALDRRLAGQGTPLEAVLCFEADQGELLRRLAGRAAAQGRTDDAEHTIRHRLEVFAVKTRPLIDYYRHRRLLTMVDGVGRVEEVTGRILDRLGRAEEATGGILDRLPAAGPGREEALAV